MQNHLRSLEAYVAEDSGHPASQITDEHAHLETLQEQIGFLLEWLNDAKAKVAQAARSASEDPPRDTGTGPILAERRTLKETREFIL